MFARLCAGLLLLGVAACGSGNDSCDKYCEKLGECSGAGAAFSVDSCKLGCTAITDDSIFDCYAEKSCQEIDDGACAGGGG